MTWALRRQLMYIGAFVILFASIGFWIGYPHFDKPPTCNDGKKNGDERGVDCGGSCRLACISTVEDPKVIWSRAFLVVPGRYNAMAYIENQNKNASVASIKYRFRFADKNNVYIGSREGETTIPPYGKFAVFEPAIDLGSSVPVYTSFEFIERPVWVEVSEDRIRQLKMTISNISLKDEGTIPKLYAELTNPSLMVVPNVNVMAILYDAENNAVAISQTFIERLAPEAREPLVFTWRTPLDKTVAVREIIPVFNIWNPSIR